MTMKISILTLLIVLGVGGTARADQDHVECPGSPFVEYPDIGLCARYDNGTSCPTGFLGQALESHDGWALDGWGCFCHTGYTDPSRSEERRVGKEGGGRAVRGR